MSNRDEADLLYHLPSGNVPAIERALKESEARGRRAGMVDALEYMRDYSRSMVVGKNEAYLCALHDLEVGATASIERLKSGGRMESTSDLMGNPASEPVKACEHKRHEVYFSHPTECLDCGARHNGKGWVSK